MITKSMIIVEDRLAEIFAYLPTMPNKDGIQFSPTFMFGDEKHLLDFLRQNRGVNKYPLIWLVYPYNEKHNRSSVEFSGLNLILAVETNSSMLNSQRLKETYAKVLIPLFNNIKECFNKANIGNIKESYDVTKFPNYSEEAASENKATYVWDALRITIEGSFNNNCLKPIIF